MNYTALHHHHHHTLHTPRCNASRSSHALVSHAPVMKTFLFALILVSIFVASGSTAFASSFLTVVAAHSTTTQDGQMRGDFSRFSHRLASHASRSCNDCHRRTDNRLVPTLSEHRDCTGCHLQQFVSVNIPMCAICHTGLNSSNPPVKNFPGIASFNVSFDHAQHNSGDARPANGCVACHAPLRRGIARTIPAGFSGTNGGHTQCYVCHTPGATANGREISSCGVCHKQADSYRRTPTTGKAFQVNFSHADHGTNQNLNCADCHNLRPGVAQSRQVSVTVAQQHILSTRAQNCATCHNGRRAFGDTNFADCKRCHTGNSFAMPS